MTKVWTRPFVYFFCLPWDLAVAWPAILIVWLFWGKNLRRETPPDPGFGGPALVCDLRKDSWPARSWYIHHRDAGGRPVTWGGTALGHGIFYGVDKVVDGQWSALQEHEHVHVEQFEVACLGSFLTGLWVGIVFAALGHFTAAWVVGLIIWFLGYLMMGVGGWSVAWLRGESPYRGSVHEEAAYAIGDLYRSRNP